MDRVVDITGVLIHEIEDYVATGMHDEASYFVRDDIKRVYAYVTVPYVRPQNSAIILLARVTDEKNYH